MEQRIIYYYQTFVGLDKLLSQRPIPITHLHLSSIHFNYIDNTFIIHLNDHIPEDPIFNEVWNQTKQLSNYGVKIVLMIGGAGGGFQQLFQYYDKYFPLLINMIRKYNWISGIDLDIEEIVYLSDVKKIIRDIYIEFGHSFIISMAPIQSSLSSDFPGMGGFIYKDLYNSTEGKLVHYFNTQAYFNYSLQTLQNIVNNGYEPNKIVLGTLSGQFTNNFELFIDILIKCIHQFPNWGGVYNWEYYTSPPDINNPSKWAQEIYNILK
jgi:chitinase